MTKPILMYLGSDERTILILVSNQIALIAFLTYNNVLANVIKIFPNLRPTNFAYTRLVLTMRTFNFKLLSVIFVRLLLWSSCEQDDLKQ